MRSIYILFILPVFIISILTQNAMAGTFKEATYQVEGKVSFDDNFGQVAPASQTAQNSDSLYSIDFRMRNIYVINKDWEMPFSIGVGYNQYTVHPTSSFAALKGSVKLTHDIGDKLTVSGTYAANDYAKMGMNTNELANYAYLSARYKMQDNFSVYTNAGLNWLVNTNVFSYSGTMLAIGGVYTFSPGTSVSAENVWFNRNYNGGRNDNRSEIILGLYQSITKDIVGVINYYGINNSSTDPASIYPRHIFSVGVRYNF